MYEFKIRVKKRDGGTGKSLREYVRPIDVTKFLKESRGVLNFEVEVLLDGDEIAMIPGEHWRLARRPNPNYQTELAQYRQDPRSTLPIGGLPKPKKWWSFDWEAYWKKMIADEKRHRSNKRRYNASKARKKEIDNST